MIEGLILWFLQIPSLALITIVALETIVLIIIFTRIPTKAFLEAARGKVLALVTRKDGRRDFIAADLIAGALDLKEYGVIQISEDSLSTIKKGGLPLVEIHTDYGVTIPPTIVHAVQKMREMGIKNIDHGEIAELGYYRCLKCKKDVFLKVDPEQVKNDKDEPTFSADGKKLMEWKVTFKCPGCKNSDENEFKKAEWIIGLPAEGIKFSSVTGFFKQQLNPILMRAIKERQLDEDRQLSISGGKMKWVSIGIGIFIACLGIAVLYMFINSSGASCVEQCKTLLDAVQVVGPSMQG